MQPLRIVHQTHQSVEPTLRFCTRSLCETNKSCCHGHNPLSVGPCRPHSLSQTDTPLLCPHYQTSSLLWVPPTSDSHRPLPRFLHLSEGAHSLCADYRISLVITYSQCKARHDLRSRGGPCCSPITHQGLLPAGCENPSTNTNQRISGLNVFRVSITCYLCTSPPFMPTHQTTRYRVACKA